MKNIIKITLVFTVLFGFISCDSKDDDTSFLNDRTSVIYFTPNAGATLLVEDGNTRTAQVQVGMSEAKPFDRSYTISIDPASEGVEGIDFILPSTTFTVPANSILGSFQVTSGDFAESTLEGKLVTFHIETAEDAQILQGRNSFNLNIVRFCPLGADFTGEYLATFNSGGIPEAGFAPALGTGVIVNVVEGSIPTERLFNVKFYPSFGFSNPPTDVVFGLICDSVIVTGATGPTGVGCTDSIEIGPADTPGVYNSDDDTSFTLNFAENSDTDCASGPALTSYTFTKQ